MAAAMGDDPGAFVGGLMDANLALAGRCAAQSDVLPRSPPLSPTRCERAGRRTRDGGGPAPGWGRPRAGPARRSALRAARRSVRALPRAPARPSGRR
ncbi:MAG: hypothetical protein U0470_10430 [Anaerolineae bacterium]